MPTDVDDAVVNFDGLDVLGATASKLGDVDGFVVDAGARRVNYIVVDSGGWFDVAPAPAADRPRHARRRTGTLYAPTSRATALRQLPEFDERPVLRVHGRGAARLRAQHRDRVLSRTSRSKTSRADVGLRIAGATTGSRSGGGWTATRRSGCARSRASRASRSAGIDLADRRGVGAQRSTRAAGASTRASAWRWSAAAGSTCLRRSGRSSRRGRTSRPDTP